LAIPITYIILISLFFFDEPEWIPVPADWSPNIVQGKTYNTDTLIGRSLWNQVQERFNRESVTSKEKTAQIAEESNRYGEGYLIHPRLGQGAFRVMVTEAYQRRCAITRYQDNERKNFAGFECSSYQTLCRRRPS
jgi:putative restriction endonuclease